MNYTKNKASGKESVSYDTRHVIINGNLAKIIELSTW